MNLASNPTSRIIANVKATFVDPESLTWELLSADLLALLDSRPYISPSRESRLINVPPASMSEDDRLYIEGSKESAVDKIDVDSTSLFRLQMPGILSEEEIIDALEELGNWEIFYGDETHKLTVSGQASLLVI